MAILSKKKSIWNLWKRKDTSPSLPPPKCKHLRVEFRFNVWTEKVWLVCLDCDSVLKKFDPEVEEERRKRDPRNKKLYNLLRKR